MTNVPCIFILILHFFFVFLRRSLSFFPCLIICALLSVSRRSLRQLSSIYYVFHQEGISHHSICSYSSLIDPLLPRSRVQGGAPVLALNLCCGLRSSSRSRHLFLTLRMRNERL